MIVNPIPVEIMVNVLTRLMAMNAAVKTASLVKYVKSILMNA